MAQLKDTNVNGDLKVEKNIVLNHSGSTTEESRSINGIHPTTNEEQKVLELNKNGNTVLGWGGYENQNGNTNVYGLDVHLGVASTGNTVYRPYYKAGDTINLGTDGIRTSGYITTSKESLNFVVPIDKPLLGNPKMTINITNCWIRQWNNYIYGGTAANGVVPTSASCTLQGSHISVNMNWSGKDLSTAVNNANVGVHVYGSIVLS